MADLDLATADEAGPDPADPPVTELLVCTKCRVRDADPEGEVRPGTHLHAALTKALGDQQGVTLHAVECLSNCTRGCSIVLRGGPDRWSFVYGNLSPEDVALVAEGTALYHGTEDGLVPWRSRPEHFRKNCIARIPPQTLSPKA